MGYAAFYVICPRASSQYVTPLCTYQYSHINSWGVRSPAYPPASDACVNDRAGEKQHPRLRWLYQHFTTRMTSAGEIPGIRGGNFEP